MPEELFLPNITHNKYIFNKAMPLELTMVP